MWDTTQMSQLPSLNRDPYDFVELSGNVSNCRHNQQWGRTESSYDRGAENLTGYGVGYSINGQRPTGTEILLDGVENIGVFSDVAGQPVPADSIQEFSIITNNFGLGIRAGVGRRCKCGHKERHEPTQFIRPFEFNRLSAYTANTYGNVANGIPKGIYTRNQFGYDAGAPILKNKLFVFVSEEFVRVRSDATETEETDRSIVSQSTAVQHPELLHEVRNRLGKPASGAVITAGQLAANSSFGEAFPKINGVTPVSPSQPVFDVVNFAAPFDAGGGLPQNTYDLVGRVDYNLDDHTTMFFRFALYSENDFSGSLFYSPYPQYNVGATSFDNSGLLSAGSRVQQQHSQLHQDQCHALQRLASRFQHGPGTKTPNLYLSHNNQYAEQTDYVTGNVIQLPGLENTDYGIGWTSPTAEPQNDLQLIEDVSWTKGRHTMHFGGRLPTSN